MGENFSLQFQESLRLRKVQLTYHPKPGEEQRRRVVDAGGVTAVVAAMQEHVANKQLQVFVKRKSVRGGWHRTHGGCG